MNKLINPSDSLFRVEDSLRLVYLLTDSQSIEVHLDKEGAEVEIYALARLDGKQQIEFTVQLFHHAAHTRSTQLVKSVLDDDSRFAFKGSVGIEKNAQKTEALQTNRNLLLSPTAQVRTQPQLIIHADDVKASHGATTGQLDEQALFYMQQRGIAPTTARQLLIDAFCEEITQYVDA